MDDGRAAFVDAISCDLQHRVGLQSCVMTRGRPLTRPSCASHLAVHAWLVMKRAVSRRHRTTAFIRRVGIDVAAAAPPQPVQLVSQDALRRSTSATLDTSTSSPADLLRLYGGWSSDAREAAASTVGRGDRPTSPCPRLLLETQPQPPTRRSRAIDQALSCETLLSVSAAALALFCALVQPCASPASQRRWR